MNIKRENLDKLCETLIKGEILTADQDETKLPSLRKLGEQYGFNRNAWGEVLSYLSEYNVVQNLSTSSRVTYFSSKSNAKEWFLRRKRVALVLQSFTGINHKIMQGIFTMANQSGIGVFPHDIGWHGTNPTPLAALKRINESESPDAFLVSIPTCPPTKALSQWFQSIQDTGKPVIFINHEWPEFNSVNSNQGHAAEVISEFIKGKGSKKPAFVLLSHDKYGHEPERQKHLKKVWRNQLTSIYFNPYSETYKQEKLAQEFLKSKCDSLIFSSDDLAHIGMIFLERAGIKNLPTASFELIESFRPSRFDTANYDFDTPKLASSAFQLLEDNLLTNDHQTTASIKINGRLVYPNPFLEGVSK